MTFLSMHPHAKYFHAFNLFNEKIGPMRYKKLLGFFGDLKNAWENGEQDDFIKAGLEEELAREIITLRPQMNLEKELANLAEEKIEILTILDENYPKLLKEIHDPPYILYTKGSFASEDEFSLGVVGTRRLSVYGRQVAQQICADLARTGLTIVSGLAQGIDTLAHLAAAQNKSRTIAVIGGGLDRQTIFPPQNRSLVDKIIENGAVISEYPPNMPSLRHHFPARNRIISGLSLGTLVIEAPEKSGALITANQALSQNREVFAVPGSIYSPNSLGPNNLIKMGAKLVSCAQDILDELNLKNLAAAVSIRQIVADNPREELILNLLSQEPLHIDKIVQDTKLDASEVNTTIVLMEMKGKVKNLGGMQYVLAR